MLVKKKVHSNAQAQGNNHGYDNGKYATGGDSSTSYNKGESERSTASTPSNFLQRLTGKRNQVHRTRSTNDFSSQHARSLYKSRSNSFLSCDTDSTVDTRDDNSRSSSLTGDEQDDTSFLSSSSSSTITSVQYISRSSTSTITREQSLSSKPPPSHDSYRSRPALKNPFIVPRTILTSR